MTRADDPDDIIEAKERLRAWGYRVVKERTYENLRQRWLGAESRVEHEASMRESTERWAHKAFEEQRRLADRLTFVYGVARARGASVQELSGTDQT